VRIWRLLGVVYLRDGDELVVAIRVVPPVNLRYIILIPELDWTNELVYKLLG
jgi:hypothetical protein